MKRGSTIFLQVVIALLGGRRSCLAALGTPSRGQERERHAF
jgi:hypothetical protein